MSMFRKAASAITPAPTEPVGDAIVTQDAEQVESPLPTTVPEEAVGRALFPADRRRVGK